MCSYRRRQLSTWSSLWLRTNTHTHTHHLMHVWASDIKTHQGHDGAFTPVLTAVHLEDTCKHQLRTAVHDSYCHLLVMCMVVPVALMIGHFFSCQQFIDSLRKLFSWTIKYISQNIDKKHEFHQEENLQTTCSGCDLEVESCCFNLASMSIKFSVESVDSAIKQTIQVQLKH